MRILIAASITIFLLSACSFLRVAVNNGEHSLESKIALEEPDSGHPVGVTYNVDSSSSPHKQCTLFFSGGALARVLGTYEYGKEKMLIDFAKQETVHVNTKDNWTTTNKLNPYEYPPIINPRAARLIKARLIGTGIARLYPYHRWQKFEGENEWEVWTDDRDHFPIYYRSIKNGEVTTWTIVNSWIDATTADRPAFFTTAPDPLPPKPIALPETVTKASKKHPRKKQGHLSR